MDQTGKWRGNVEHAPKQMSSRVLSRVPGTLLRRRGVLLAAGTACLTAAPAMSASREVVIAQVAPFSGPLAAYAQDIAKGAEACFSAFNRRTPKGVQIRLAKVDDQGDVAKTVQLFKETARKERPLAFIYPLAPPAIEAVLAEKLPRQLGIPLLGTVPSLQKVPGAVDPYVFHLGAAENVEINKILEHAATVNLREVAVVYWDTPGVRALVEEAKATAGAH